LFFDVQQNTEEWLDLRIGLVTSSSLSKVMANYGKAFGEPAKKYAVDIAIEQITESRQESQFSNSHMDRGHEEEPLAIMEYESKYFSTVTNGGFFVEGNMGDSPDGLVGDDGMIEVKSAIPSMHYSRVCSKSYDRAYRWQMANHLLVSNRDWVDFISYCSSYPDDQMLYVHRSDRDDFKEEFKMIDERMVLFTDLIKKTKENILSGEYSIIK